MIKIDEFMKNANYNEIITKALSSEDKNERISYEKLAEALLQIKRNEIIKEEPAGNISATKFELDEEKIVRLSGKTLKEVYDYIDEIAKKSHLRKIEKGYYECYEPQNGSAYLGSFVCNYMIEISWFTRSLKNWIWLENGGIKTTLLPVQKKITKEFGTNKIIKI